jgi:hypothetical protein
MKHFLNDREITLQNRNQPISGIRGQQLQDRPAMTVTNGRDDVPIAEFALPGHVYRAYQLVRDAGHCRYDNKTTGFRPPANNFDDLTKARGISDTGAAKLVDDARGFINHRKTLQVMCKGIEKGHDNAATKKGEHNSQFIHSEPFLGDRPASI